MTENRFSYDSSLLGPLPDPNRVGGPGWLKATGGRLTNQQRARMLADSLTTQRKLIGQRLRPRAAWSLVHGFVDLELLGRFPSKANMKRSWDFVLQMIDAL